MQAKKNVSFSILSKIIELILPFIVRTILIKTLGDEYVGLNSLFTSILQVLSLAELGISSAIVFCMYKPIEEKNYTLVYALYNWIRRAYKIIGLIVLLIGLLIMPFLNFFIEGGVPSNINVYILYLIYLFNTVISYFLFSYRETIFTAYQRVDLTSIISLITSSILNILQIILLIFFRNYYVYILVLPATTILKNVLTYMLSKKKFKNIVPYGNLPSEVKNNLRKMVLGLMSYKIGGVCRNSFDSITISAILGLVLLAKYNNYYYIISAVSSIISISSNAIIPIIGKNVAIKKSSEIYCLFEKISYILEWVALACSCYLIALIQPFIIIWVGEERLFSDSTMLIFVAYFFTLIISSIVYSFRQATGIWWKDAVRPIIESVINLILNFVLVFYLGVVGVIITTIITIVFINIPWGTHILFKYYFSIPMKKYLITLIASSLLSVIVGLGCYFTTALFPTIGLIPILFRFLIATIFAALAFPILHILDYRQKESIKFMLNFIKEKNK